MTNRCPTTADLAAFIDARADRKLHDEVREHIVNCEQCYEVVSEGLARAETEAAEAEEPSPKRFFERPAAKIAAGLVAAIGLFWLVANRSTPEERLLAASTQRTTLSRISGLEHQPLDVVRGRGGIDAPDGLLTNQRLLAEAARVRKEAASRPTDETLYALGLAYLLMDSPEAAVEPLRRSLDLDPASWRTGNELGGALIEWGLRSDSKATIADGLEVLSAAVEKHPDQLELRFNRALALELLGLREAAIEAWQAYLVLDPASSWAEEAAKRLDRLLKIEAAGPSSESVERLVLEQLLPAWAAATQEGRDDEATEILRQANEVAIAHRAAHGDPLLPATLDALSAEGGAAAGAQRLLAYAHARERRRVGDTKSCLAASARALAPTGGTSRELDSLVLLNEAGCRFPAPEIDAVRAATLKVLELEEGAEMPSRLLLGQAEWLLGLLAHKDRRPVAALASYRRALAHFRAAHDIHREASVQALLGELYDYLGQEEEAWQSAVLAVSISQQDPARRYQALALLAKISCRRELPRLATAIAGDMVTVAREVENPGFTSDAWLTLGRALESADEDERARAAFAEALAIAERITDPVRRERSVSQTAIQLAEALVDEDPPAARAMAERATRTASRTSDLDLRVARVNARAAVAAGHRSEGIQILDSAVRRSSRERATLASLTARDDLFMAREALHWDLIRLLLEDDRGLDALLLLDAWRNEPFTTAGESRLDRSVLSGDGGATFLAFLSLPEQLVVWQWASGEIQVRQVDVSRERLRELVASEVDPTATVSYSRNSRLADLLFESLEIASTERLVIFPDALLSALPFAAMTAGGGGPTLVEIATLEVAPSLASWLARSEQAAGPLGCPVVLVGAASGGETFLRLKRLQLLEDEARAVEAIHTCATRVSDLGKLGAALAMGPRLIHFAGHSVSGSPFGGGLLLGPPENPILTLSALEQWPIRGSTVVLSACSTADGRPSATAGRDGPARALISAGARNVIANLWPVDDADALELSTRLHRELKKGRTAAEALRSAQLDLIAEGRPLSAWGGWRVLGAA